MKDMLKSQLRVIGLYGLAHQVWMRRPNLRLASWNAGYRLAGAADRLPIPPARLMFQVDLSQEVAWFLLSGRMSHGSLCYALWKNGYHPESFEAILDFGCGCGRVMRCWQSLAGPKLYGTDYNPQLIEWCNRNLSRLARFSTNHLAPPLDYAGDTFDLIYALSVFTHLTEDLQIQWMAELTRVVKPGGLLLITLHGDRRADDLTPEEHAQYLSGHMVVKRPEDAGSNLCGAYHPEAYVCHCLARGLEMVDHIPGGARDSNQDIYLLRKRPVPGAARIPARSAARIPARIPSLN